jgi:uncharacterized protein (DUF3084 family)
MIGTGLAIGVLVAVCGFIAYMGDLLGRRLGKRRLTLWGLRPRHTAIVCTVLTGMLIAVFSLAVLVSLSAGVRRAVLQGEALLRENRSLRADNRARARRLAELSRQSQEQQAQNAGLAATERKLTDRVRVLKGELAEREEQNGVLRTERARLETRIARLEATGVSLKRSQRALQGHNAELRDANRLAKQQLGGAQQQLRVAMGGLERTKHDLRQARKEYQDLTRQAGQKVARLRERERLLADERIIARANEELARAPVEAGADPRTVRDTVETVIRRSEQEVRRRHQAAGVTPASRLVVWQPRWAAPSDIVNTMTELIQARGEPIVLRAVVDENAASGGTVPMRLATTPRRLAFRDGEEIAALSLDGAQTEGELLRELLAFLQGDVRQRALRRSVLPAGDGRVGELQYDPLLDTIKQVRAIGGTARVSVVAAGEVRSEGPLRVDFRVVPWESRLAGER